MLASNILLEISGDLHREGELYKALEFALIRDNSLEGFMDKGSKSRCVYQITEDGRYCIGWAFDGVKEGWSEYSFDFDLDIISQIISKHLSTQEVKYGLFDGSYYKGFVMRAIPESLAKESNGIKNPFFGIVEFSPYTCFYSK